MKKLTEEQLDLFYRKPKQTIVKKISNVLLKASSIAVQTFYIGIIAVHGTFYELPKPKSEIKNNEDYKKYNDTPKRESVYDNKIEFFDKYREIDHYLASLIGLNYKGITYFIAGAIGKGKTDYYRDDDWWDMINTLKRIREYRNMLGHDKSKWQSLPDPDPSYVRYLRTFGANVSSNKSKMANLVEGGYYYFKSLV